MSEETETFNILKNAKPANEQNDSSGFNLRSAKKQGNPEESENQEGGNEDVSQSQEQEQGQESNNNNENKDTDEKLQQNEEQSQEGQDSKGQKQVQQEEENVSLKDEDVLSFLKEKGIEAESLDDLNKPKQDSDIPEELKGYLDYKEKTNRGYQDYLELQKDWKNEDENVTLKRYLKEKNPFYTDEDIKDELSEFEVNEDIDEDSDIRKKNRKKKGLLSEAVSYLESQKEKYKAPKEGSSEEQVQVPDEYKQAKDKLNEIESFQKEQQDLVQKRHQEFLEKTKSIFNEDFEGFKFDINGEEKVFKSSEPQKLQESQADVANFIGKFTDENGVIKDHKGYHKALNAAMNPDLMAKHFYELGKSEAIKEESKSSKNINFSGHKDLDYKKKSGITMKPAGNEGSGRITVKRKVKN